MVGGEAQSWLKSLSHTNRKIQKVVGLVQPTSVVHSSSPVVGMVPANSLHEEIMQLVRKIGSQITSDIDRRIIDLVIQNGRLAHPLPNPQTGARVEYSSSEIHVDPTSIDIPESTFQALSQLLGKSSSFTCPEQAAIVQLMREGQYDVLGILPTGAGKSLAYILTAGLLDSPGGLTVVVVPYISLSNDLFERTKRLHIPCCVWSSSDHVDTRTRIIYVVLESACEDSFHTYLRQRQERLC